MSITNQERQQIKDWILASAIDPSFIRKMQDNSMELSPEFCVHVNTDYDTGNDNHGITFNIRVKAFKDYAANHGINQQGLLKFLGRRGVCFWRNIHSEQAEAREIPASNPKRTLSGWLIEAQTGFFNITENEFQALQNAPQYADLGSADPRDRYRDIFSARPSGALQKISFDEFKQIRIEALTEKSLLLNAPPAAPATQPEATPKHTAKVAAPASSWVEADRTRQAALSERLVAGLNLAAQQSTEMDALLATLTEKQAAHKATLADLQSLQQQIATAAKSDGRPLNETASPRCFP